MKITIDISVDEFKALANKKECRCKQHPLKIKAPKIKPYEIRDLSESIRKFGF